MEHKRYKNHKGLHLELLQISLILGRYDRSRQEMENLYRLADRLNNRQKLQLQLLSIDYMISTNKSSLLKEELKTTKELLGQMNRLRGKTKEKIQRNIRLCEYLTEEKWEDVLKLLEDTERLSKNATVFEQVKAAYIKGKSCYRLGRYKEAYDELRFVIQKGGDSLLFV